MSAIPNEEKIHRQRQVASTFAEAAAFLRGITAAQDYFTGYTTLEAIDERIAEIGKSSTSTTETYRGRLTRLASLNVFEKVLLDTIKATRELGAIDIKKYDTGVAGTEENPVVAK